MPALPCQDRGELEAGKKDTKTGLNGKRSCPTAWNCGHRQKDDRGRRRERKLIRIDPLGTAADLRALQLLDDGFKALDLTVSVLNNRRHVTHKMPQKSRFAEQIVEVERHIQIYPKRNARTGLSRQDSGLRGGYFADMFTSC
ncbi:hypothetical protein [Mesorhizobium sp.]|uniref:hypothetical protein n=1 Tax=Mesorhizobium sp. TaxID=1871066 RepID=UPI000FE6F415|nr:hypothetical protein [Mesorhizobium sp.]RWC33617.1 MAG: hypothetical protein EOS27_02905 [Mesorhizobium sp.]TIX21349.1 MAG: hypothetical protein E5V35_29785 [Mesorhizobium sp.]